MADVELVIKIPEEIRLVLINDIQLSIDQQSICDSCITSAIIDGHPLPKGHGNLIDLNDLMAKMVDFCVVYDEIMEVPTIIKAESDGEKND